MVLTGAFPAFFIWFFWFFIWVLGFGFLLSIIGGSKGVCLVSILFGLVQDAREEGGGRKRAGVVVRCSGGGDDDDDGGCGWLEVVVVV